MSTWAPNVRVVLDNGYGSSRRGNDVIGAITHHVAGFDGRDYVANYNSRSSHPTYHISRNGTVTGIVHPDRKPSSTGGSIDSSCITVEIDNTGVGGDWPVSQAALDAWSVIVRHHADESIRAGKAIEKNIPGKLQNGFFVGWHSQYVQTTCPGPFVVSHLGGVIAKANGVSVPSSSTPTPIPTPAHASKGSSTMYFIRTLNGTVFLVTPLGSVRVSNPSHLTLLIRMLKSAPGTFDTFNDAERDIIFSYISSAQTSDATRQAQLLAALGAIKFDEAPIVAAVTAAIKALGTTNITEAQIQAIAAGVDASMKDEFGSIPENVLGALTARLGK